MSELERWRRLLHLRFSDCGRETICNCLERFLRVRWDANITKTVVKLRWNNWEKFDV